MKFRKDHRGLTLVELLVALAILAILTLAVLGFVSSGTGSYRSVSATVNLQTESQLTMNQVRQYLLDCNGGVYADASSLTILSGEAGVYTAHIFTLEDDGLYYEKKQVGEEAGDQQKVSSHVAAFSVSPGPVGETTAVTLSMTFAYSGKTYDAQETVAMRNRVYAAASYDSLLEVVCGGE